MNKLTRSLLIILILSLGLWGLLGYIRERSVGTVQAAGSLVVTFPTNPLFNEINWLPGDSVTKSFTVENNGSEGKLIGIRTNNEVETPPVPGLAGVQMVVVKEVGGPVWYGQGSGTGPKTLKQLFEETAVPLSTVGAGVTKTYEITITMLASAGNEYQNAKVQFDLVVMEDETPIELPSECQHLAGVITQVIMGTDGDDKLNGTGASELIIGKKGKDKIEGKGGHDCLVGNEGEDRINGGTGRDVILGGEGNDQLDGHSDEDRVYGGGGDDEMKGNEGNDLMYGGEGNDKIDAGNQQDEVYGENGNDEIEGGEGQDVIHGGAGNDVIDGESGDDTIFGEGGNDVIRGGSHNDTASGGTGNDQLRGSSGDDKLFGDEDTDSADGDSGIDTCVAETEVSCEL